MDNNKKYDISRIIRKILSFYDRNSSVFLKKSQKNFDIFGNI